MSSDVRNMPVSPAEFLASRRALVAAAAVTATGIAATGRATLARGQTPVAVTPSVDLDAFDAFCEQALATYAVPGAVVALVQDGVPVMVKGYGVRDHEKGGAVDADTVFQLASVTKSLTAFTLATLVDEGALDWDTPVAEILPELRLQDSYATLNVTARDLLAHRSGLPAFTGDLLGTLGYDRAELVRQLRFIPPASSFREVAAYSNMGYFIAGEVIARITGAPWEQAYQERLLEPAGMQRSGPSPDDLPADANRSSNHATVGGEVRTVEPDFSGVAGAGGAGFSTGNDLVRWMQLMLGGGEIDGQRLLQPETVTEMFQPGMVADLTIAEAPPIDEHAGFSFTMGWANFHYQGYEVIEKGGALPGIRASVCLVPELNLGIAVLANQNLTFYPEAVRTFVLEQVAGPGAYDMQHAIQELDASIASLFEPAAPMADPQSLTVPLANLAGVYENTLYGQFEVVAEADTVRIEAGPARKPANLDHLSLNTFLLDWESVTQMPDPTTFVIGPDGVAVAFENESLGRFDRVTAP